MRARDMVKLCRACQKQVANRGGVCDRCRSRVLRDPIAPTQRPRAWMLAGLLVCLLSVASSLIAAAVMTHQIFPWRHALSKGHVPSIKSPVAYTSTMPEEQLTRKVYPYSIVPGGAETLDEAKRAMHDPATKANYAAIDFTKLRLVKLRRNLTGYVSYRSGEKIYWTSDELTLRMGETVFTDGVHLVRGRGLNVYSPDPMLPIGPN